MKIYKLFDKFPMLSEKVNIGLLSFGVTQIISSFFTEPIMTNYYAFYQNNKDLFPITYIIVGSISIIIAVVSYLKRKLIVSL
jgi:hypothetical protein